MRTKKTYVNTTHAQYPIYIGTGLRHQAELMLDHISGQQVLLVTNQTIAAIYLDELRALFKTTDKQYQEIILSDGEQYKNLESLTLIFDTLLNHQYTRNCTLLALGGGVIGDMTGFAAACYQRGVNFIQIPTTLLAQVDASVGGKTAVNHRIGKNMIGAFYQPQCVIIDIDTLKTLPKREFRAGLAEVIKHALIQDKGFWDWLVKNIEQVINLDEQALQYTIEKCCSIKANIVACDEKEQGIRAILNFGHTFAHALESGLGYGVYLHGEAVAIGMMIATRLSVLLGTLNQHVITQLQHLLDRCGLPTRSPSGFSKAQYWQHMQLDKKSLDSQLRFITLTEIGHAHVVTNVPQTFVEQALD